MMSTLSLDKDGAELASSLLSATELTTLDDLFERRLHAKAGTRLTGDRAFASIFAPTATLTKIATERLGVTARPVRAVLFDKTAEMNWPLGWHQDRTIALCRRIETPGFGPWSLKQGITHVEPPFELWSRMITLRAHLDEANADNAALIIAPGSHTLGRIPHSDVGRVVERCGKYTCAAQRGSIWIYRSSILHASDAALRPNRRRVLHVDFSAEDLPNGLEWLGVDRLDANPRDAQTERPTS